MDTVIIAVIVAAALGFAVYRIFVRPSCSCGCGCGGKKRMNGTGPGAREDDGSVSDTKSAT
ncbi:MAG: FeoB-associated Cys-rich membrane protein [Deltaproteobacteria bacterium]|nr:FeoB-associated Cys-rich membrane protein [Deltaproteobacteria bacterium]